jgi:hypothetical protein
MCITKIVLFVLYHVTRSNFILVVSVVIDRRLVDNFFLRLMIFDDLLWLDGIKMLWSIKIKGLESDHYIDCRSCNIYPSTGKIVNLIVFLR